MKLLDKVSSLMVGAQKCGETQFIVDLLDGDKKKALVISPDLREPKYANCKLITIDEVAKNNHRAHKLFDSENPFFLRRIYNEFINGCVILDDTKI